MFIFSWMVSIMFFFYLYSLIIKAEIRVDMYAHLRPETITIQNEEYNLVKPRKFVEKMSTIYGFLPVIVWRREQKRIFKMFLLYQYIHSDWFLRILYNVFVFRVLTLYQSLTGKAHIPMLTKISYLHHMRNVLHKKHVYSEEILNFLATPISRTLSPNRDVLVETRSGMCLQNLSSNALMDSPFWEVCAKSKSNFQARLFQS